jgi:hypothetical protein
MTGIITFAPSQTFPGSVGVSTFSGGSTGLGPFAPVAGPVTLTGVLSVSNGGTGATSQSDAANAILPPQSGQSGNYLITNGTTASWSSISGTTFPAGTQLVFAQATAPVGWTQVVNASYNDAAIRITAGSGGATGGSLGFSTLFSATSTYSGGINITSGQVGNTTLSVNQMASHNHTQSTRARRPWAGATGAEGSPNSFGSQISDTLTTTNTGGSQSHTHSLVGVSAVGNFTSNFSVKYIDMIVASKN